MRTRALQRRATLSTVSVEPFSSIDTAGENSYSTSQDIEAWARKTTEFVPRADGSNVRVDLTLFVPGDASPVPAEKDRLTYDGATYIVEMVQEGRSVGGVLDHVVVKARDE